MVQRPACRFAADLAAPLGRRAGRHDRARRALVAALESFVALLLVVSLPDAASAESTSAASRIAALVERAEAAQRRGDLVEAQPPLEAARRLAEASEDPGLRAAVTAARGHLAMTLRSPAAGRALLEAARADAEAARATKLLVTIDAHEGNSHALEAATLSGEARSAAWARARDAYRRALSGIDGAEPGDPADRARLLANLARAEERLDEGEDGDRGLDAASKAIAQVPSPRARTELLLHFAETVAPRSREAIAPARRKQAHAAASEALTLAVSSDDDRGQALALLALARLYRLDGQPAAARALLDRAHPAAVRADDPVARYRGWLASAELHRDAGDTDAALAAYAQALDEAELLRPLRARSYGLAPSLRAERLQAAHLAYVDLLLRRAGAAEKADADAHGGIDRREADLALAQRSLERQKAQELRDFFDDECVDAALRRRVDAGEVDPAAALVYPIALDDRLELVVTGRNGRTRAAVAVPRERLREVATAFRQLVEIRSHQRYLRPARQLYDWLIRPIEDTLAAWEVETLVFVPDATLRALPLAALHDGERFLIERFAVASTPGLDLTLPRPLAAPDRLALAGGLSVSREGFASLPFVEEELEAVASILDTDLLLNERFTPARFERGLATRPVSVLHVATHARFDSRDEAFVLTHDGRISMDALSDALAVFRDRAQPLEILVLSACETAAGDEEAALGLAGIAVQSGARSAIGTLWVVNDSAASEVAERFYRGVFDPLAPRSRAAALAEAQRALLERPRYRHPAYWAPFLLIGSWL